MLGAVRESSTTLFLGGWRASRVEHQHNATALVIHLTKPSKIPRWAWRRRVVSRARRKQLASPARSIRGAWAGSATRPRTTRRRAWRRRRCQGWPRGARTGAGEPRHRSGIDSGRQRGERLLRERVAALVEFLHAMVMPTASASLVRHSPSICATWWATCACRLSSSINATRRARSQEAPRGASCASCNSREIGDATRAARRRMRDAGGVTPSAAAAAARCWWWASGRRRSRSR
jgi:hypothetical protein